MGNTQSASDPYIPIPEKQASRKPQPFVGSFFDGQMASPLPHTQATKPNRSPGHVNFFEVAAVTAQPAKSIKSSNSSSFNSSTTKKSSTVYPNNHSHNSTTLTSSLQTPPPPLPTIPDQPTPNKDDTNYTTMNGRRYWKGHGSQNFMLPCDDDETDRIMTMHYILKATFHGSFTAPVNKLLESEHTKVLDIGCGSGTWILEMATEFPNAEFHGVDDCPLFPQHIKPGNSKFKLHNVIEGLPYPDNEFDYVHMRSMIFYFTPEELSHLLSEIARVLKPGGYFEIVDTNYTIRNPGPISNKLINTDLKQLIYSPHTNMTLSSQHESSTNHPIFSFLMLAPQLPAASFVGSFIDISQQHAMLPLGDWEGGQLGKLHSLNFESLISNIQCKTQDQKVPLTKQLVIDIVDECDRYKSYLDWFACYARKPPLENQQIEQSTLDSINEFVQGFVDV